MGPIGLLNAFVSFLLVLTTAKAASLRRREAEPEPVGMDVLRKLILDRRSVRLTTLFY